MKQFKDILNNRVKLNKKIEMEFNGMLKIRVYERGLGKLYLFDEKILEKVSGWKVPIGFTYKDFLIHDFEERSYMIILQIFLL